MRRRRPTGRARSPAPRHRKDQEAEQQREGEVDAAGGNIADDGEVQHERERRGDPELVKRTTRSRVEPTRTAESPALAAGPGTRPPRGSCRPPSEGAPPRMRSAASFATGPPSRGSDGRYRRAARRPAPKWNPDRPAPVLRVPAVEVRRLHQAVFLVVPLGAPGCSGAESPSMIIFAGSRLAKAGCRDRKSSMFSITARTTS